MHDLPKRERPFRRLKARLFPEIPRRPILVGTHHKTGTVWMKRVFVAWANRVALPFHQVERGRPPPVPLAAPAVYFDPHSAFADAALADRRARGVHLVRDPRDVIVSAAYYHARADNPEPWLHRPNDSFGGASYCEAITAREPSERLRFEMEHSSNWTIKSLAAWNYRDRRFVNLRYEDLLADVNLQRFRRAFRFLGLRGQALATALDEAWNNSLFSGLAVKAGDPDYDHLAKLHVRSGAARQWEHEFTRADGVHFRTLFGDVLVRFGYEVDDAWIDRLRA